MLTSLILAAAMTGQFGCASGQCARGGYNYVPAAQYVQPQPHYAPYIPLQPRPAPSPNVLRPVPPSPYKGAAGPTVAELDRKIDALTEQVKALAGVKRAAGPCTCGPECKCTCGCAGGSVVGSPPATAFRFQ